MKALTASPGRWAQVVLYPDAKTATAMAARLRGGWVAVPEGRWEFEALPNGAGSALFAR